LPAEVSTVTFFSDFASSVAAADDVAGVAYAIAVGVEVVWIRCSRTVVDAVLDRVSVIIGTRTRLQHIRLRAAARQVVAVALRLTDGLVRPVVDAVHDVLGV
jgi:hypothetical protein